MGVLCHNNQENIEQLLRHALPKMKPGAFSCHQYADWEKLESYGWQKGGVPSDFQDKPDDEIWWPRNTQTDMSRMASSVGWDVVYSDLDLIDRDSIIQLRRD